MGPVALGVGKQGPFFAREMHRNGWGPDGATSADSGSGEGPGEGPQAVGGRSASQTGTQLCQSAEGGRLASVALSACAQLGARGAASGQGGARLTGQFALGSHREQGPEAGGWLGQSYEAQWGGIRGTHWRRGEQTFVFTEVAPGVALLVRCGAEFRWSDLTACVLSVYNYVAQVNEESLN